VRAHWEASRATLKRAVAHHWEAVVLDATGVLPTDGTLLAASGAANRRLIQARARALRKAADEAQLTADERRQTELALSRLSTLEEGLDAGSSVPEKDDHCDTPLPLSPLHLIDPRVAHQQVDSVYPGIRSGGVLAWELKVPTTGVAVNSSKGRKTLRFLDRVAFAAAAMERWGSVFLQRYAALGRLTLGPLRGSARLIALLNDGRGEARLAGVVAGLGLLDTPKARAAVVQYASRLIEAWELAVPSIQMQLAIVFALAPKPAGGVATGLGAEESSVLSNLAGLSRSRSVQEHIARVQRAWLKGNAIESWWEL
jgi:hypothetical protein